MIIKALREYLPNKRASRQHNTKTIILWNLLIQECIFVQGEMVVAQGCIGEFTNMVNQLRRKKMWEYFTRRGYNRTYTPRRKETEHLDKGREKSGAPGKKGEEGPRGKRRRGAKETAGHSLLEYWPQRSFSETAHWSKLPLSIPYMLYVINVDVPRKP